MESSLAGSGGKRPMQDLVTRRMHPALRELVMEASQALARLDAERLEELSLSCQALNRDLVVPEDAEGRAILAQQTKDVAKDMAVFAKVIEATRANLNVMNRLRELRADQLEYGERQVREWAPTGSSHGDN